jgi:hypothetical protein
MSSLCGKVLADCVENPKLELYYLPIYLRLPTDFQRLVQLSPEHD